jgi:hypothetical protein
LPRGEEKTHNPSLRIIGKQSPAISGKQVGVWAGSQRLILRDEQSEFADAHRDDGKRFVLRADEKLTAFLELERVMRRSNVFNLQGNRTTNRQ